VIIAPGEKVFGALLAIAGAGIILTGHWATTDDMIAFETLTSSESKKPCQNNSVSYFSSYSLL
jgi:hypothetical protein